jgi:lysozyme
LLEADIDDAISNCLSIFPNFDNLSDVRQRVLVDMMFNLGEVRFRGFKRLIAAVKSGDYERASQEMEASKWHTQVKSRAQTLETMMRTNADP